jgi:hypothetical protein
VWERCVNWGSNGNNGAKTRREWRRIGSCWWERTEVYDNVSAEVHANCLIRRVTRIYNKTNNILGLSYATERVSCRRRNSSPLVLAFTSLFLKPQSVWGEGGGILGIEFCLKDSSRPKYTSRLNFQDASNKACECSCEMLIVVWLYVTEVGMCQKAVAKNLSVEFNNS